MCLGCLTNHKLTMGGLEPPIQRRAKRGKQKMDGRVKPGHGDGSYFTAGMNMCTLMMTNSPCTSWNWCAVSGGTST
jgi:hypothetical protein